MATGAARALLERHVAAPPKAKKAAGGANCGGRNPTQTCCHVRTVPRRKVLQRALSEGPLEGRGPQAGLPSARAADPRGGHGGVPSGLGAKPGCVPRRPRQPPGRHRPRPRKDP